MAPDSEQTKAFSSIGTCVLLLAVSAHVACASAPTTRPDIASSSQTVGITDEMIGARYAPMQISQHAESATYGYSETQPVVIGGGFEGGSDRVYSFLNALRGPQGEKVHYRRVGTCCSFQTPNSPFDGTALLEVYEISYDGAREPRRLYFNWYDSPDPLVPVGLTVSE